MKKKALLFVAAGLALAGCVSSGGRQAVTEVTFSSQSPNPLFGYDQIAVQAYGPKDLSKVISRFDVQSGVPCQVKGENFSASMVTPAEVLLPDYGPLSKPVTVTCTYQGITRSATYAAFDATAAAAGRDAQGDIENASAGEALGGILAGALAQAVVGRDRKGRNDWTYPVLRVSYQSLEK